jgi:hypothetical protein
MNTFILFLIDWRLSTISAKAKPRGLAKTTNAGQCFAIRFSPPFFAV